MGFDTWRVLLWNSYPRQFQAFHTYHILFSAREVRHLDTVHNTCQCEDAKHVAVGWASGPVNHLQGSSACDLVQEPQTGIGILKEVGKTSWDTSSSTNATA